MAVGDRDDPRVQCLLSHKCNDKNHNYGSMIRGIFDKYGVGLLIDEFAAGGDIDTQIETFNIHALLFLSTIDSNKSRYCDKELKAASRRSIPIFAVQLEGPIKKQFRHRIIVNLQRKASREIYQQLSKLALEVYKRALYYKRIMQLTLTQFPEDGIQLAKHIYNETEGKVLAEFVNDLKNRFCQMQADPNIQFWLASSIGKAKTHKALSAIKYLLDMDIHPYARAGLEMAYKEASGKVIKVID